MEDYITDLTQKVEKLEQIQVDMKIFLRQSNTTTLVGERQQRNEALVKAHEVDTVTKFDSDERVLVDNGGVYNRGMSGDVIDCEQKYHNLF